jgi:hypothetical protein
MVGWLMNELRWIWKGAVVTQSRTRPIIYLEGLTKEWKASVRIVGVPVEIRIETLPNKVEGGTATITRSVVLLLYV